MRKAPLVLALVLLLAALAAPATARSETDTATVTLVHAFRGLLADVYLDGERILEGFAPERSTDPTPIPAGPHNVAVREADAPPDSEPVVEGDVDLPAGAILSAVVHPDAEGAPTISVFENDFGDPGDDAARAVVRHVAVAPPITVEIGNATAAESLAPGEEAANLVDPGADEITTTDASSSEQLLAPARFSAEQNATVALYLIGSAEDDSLGWLSERLDVTGAAAPAGVPTGTSGLRATPATPWWAVAAGVVALLIAVRMALLSRRALRSTA